MSRWVFFFQLECKYKALQLGFRGIEHPIQFAERQIGYSKMNKKILWEALWLAHKISDFRLLKQVFCFAVTGGLGTITNLLCFYFLVEAYNIVPMTLASIMAFLLAATQNYFINSLWTFRSSLVAPCQGSDILAKNRPQLNITRWLHFLAASSLGLGVNVMVLNILVFGLDIQKIWAQACGILAGLVFNFIMSKVFVFGNRQEKRFKKHLGKGDLAQENG